MKASNGSNGDGAPAPSTGLYTVLVIDDSEIARDQVKALVSNAGMHAVDLASPIGATRAIIDHHVDVVVIDFFMPGMRGDRLAALFRGNPRFKKLGVVMISGEASTELERLCEDAGADAVVRKAELSKLVPAIRAALRKRQWLPAPHG
jgi:CheY-like chemotaxis protein